MSEMIVVNDSTITTCAIAGLGSFSHAFRVSSSAAALGLDRVALASPKGFADALCANGDAPLLAVDAAPASAKGDPPAGFEGAAAPKGDAGFAAGADAGAAAPKGDAGLAAAGAAAPKGDAGVAAADVPLRASRWRSPRPARTRACRRATRRAAWIPRMISPSRTDLRSP
jgi:hypothetical protein